KDRTITKKYNAFVWGEMKEEFGTINRAIGRSGSDFRKFSTGRGKRGDLREAETYWTKIATGFWKVPEEDREEKVSFLEIEPKTGRTHQIRVHLSAINHPVIGDKLYAAKKPFLLGFLRLALHSRFIEFENLDGKKIKIEASLPLDFQEAGRAAGFDLES
ncbi:MAG: pseudouridine synthase, partial [Candidatus Paceibacterota bacterium]